MSPLASDSIVAAARWLSNRRADRRTTLTVTVARATKLVADAAQGPALPAPGAAALQTQRHQMEAIPEQRRGRAIQVDVKLIEPLGQTGKKERC